MALRRGPSFSIEGLSDVDAMLGDLKKATGRNVMRRVALKALQPIAEDTRQRAPDDPRTGGMDLKNSITATTKKPKGHRKEAEVEAYAGAGPVPHAHLQEFGTVNHGPQPFARPAWDAGKDQIIPGLAEDFRVEIDKATQRAARKAARLAAKG